MVLAISSALMIGFEPVQGEISRRALPSRFEFEKGIIISYRIEIGPKYMFL